MSKNISIIYLDRNKFDCILPHQTNLISYDFPPQIVKDFEVLNKDLLYSEIHDFITNNHLSPYPVIIILSNNVIFEKDLTVNKPDQISEETTLFLEKVPFETVLHKTLKIDKKTIVVATNKIYLDLIKEAFEKDQCKMLFILPESLFGDLISQKGLDTIVAKKILGSMDSFKQYDLSHIPYIHSIPQPHEENLTLPEKKSYARLIILLVFFVVLIGILTVLFLISRQEQPSKSKTPQIPIKQVSITPFSIPLSTIVITPFVEITPPSEEEVIVPEPESSESAIF